VSVTSTTAMNGSGLPVGSEDQSLLEEELYVKPNAHQSPQLSQLVKPHLSPQPSRSSKPKLSLQPSQSAKQCLSSLSVKNVASLGVSPDLYSTTDDEDSIYEEIHSTSFKHITHGMVLQVLIVNRKENECYISGGNSQSRTLNSKMSFISKKNCSIVKVQCTTSMHAFTFQKFLLS